MSGPVSSPVRFHADARLRAGGGLCLAALAERAQAAGEAAQSPFLPAVVALSLLIAAGLAAALIIGRRKNRTILAATQQLAESEERFRQIAESVGEVFWVGSPDWAAVHYISPAYERVWGRSCASLLAAPLSWLEAVHPDDRPLLQAVIARYGIHGHGSVQFPEYRILRPDGSERWILARAYPVRDPAGRVLRIVGIAEDITESKRAEMERLQLHEQLAQAQKMEAVGRLAGGIAHDFNNMLAVILGQAELAQLGAGADARLRARLEDIRAAATRAATLTRQLLGYARQQTALPRVLDLNATIDGLTGALRQLAGARIRIDWRPGTDLWPVWMDPGQIEQILVNLCVNARDAIDGAGQIVISTQNCTVRPPDCAGSRDCLPGDYVRCTVSDDGSGIDQATLAHLFEPFYTTKGLGKGTGLGLALVYGIVRQNGGYIGVQTQVGAGTTFSICLPRRTDADRAGPAAASADAGGPRPATILVVEDEPMVLSMTTAMLEDLGYAVLAARSARSAREALDTVHQRNGHIDLLVSDVIMPGMTGTDLVEQLRAWYPDLRCLLVSGHAADTVGPAGADAPATHFLQKPYSLQELGMRVQQLLRPAGKAGAD